MSCFLSPNTFRCQKPKWKKYKFKTKIEGGTARMQRVVKVRIRSWRWRAKFSWHREILFWAIIIQFLLLRAIQTIKKSQRKKKVIQNDQVKNNFYWIYRKISYWCDKKLSHCFWTVFRWTRSTPLDGKLLIVQMKEWLSISIPLIC